jgi:transcriptional regulator with XRE-family HTH domain
MDFREMRIKRGLTQQELGDAAGVTKQSISNIETKRACNLKYSTMKALAFALGVSTDVVAQAIAETQQVG